ncbi:hypothetical protein PIB30_078039, partial [Stylosanthes scabra]|nr:hypothetical protein [Stylosanthes scabra]
KLKDRDFSMCPRCNDVFDAEDAEIFQKERMKKELARREEHVRQCNATRRATEPVPYGRPHHNLAAMWMGEVHRHRDIELREREAYEARYQARRVSARGHFGGRHAGPRGNHPRGRGRGRRSFQGKPHQGVSSNAGPSRVSAFDHLSIPYKTLGQRHPSLSLRSRYLQYDKQDDHGEGYSSITIPNNLVTSILIEYIVNGLQTTTTGFCGVTNPTSPVLVPDHYRTHFPEDTTLDAPTARIDSGIRGIDSMEPFRELVACGGVRIDFKGFLERNHEVTEEEEVKQSKVAWTEPQSNPGSKLGHVWT